MRVLTPRRLRLSQSLYPPRSSVELKDERRGLQDTVSYTGQCGSPMKISSCPDAQGHKEIKNGPGRNWIGNHMPSCKEKCTAVYPWGFSFSFFVFRTLIALSPPSLQKMKEYLEGRNLITKLQAKHDLLQKTLGESECGGCWRFGIKGEAGPWALLSLHPKPGEPDLVT